MSTTIATLDATGGPSMMVFAEIALPPLGYLIRFREEGAPLPREVRDMPDISFFGEYRYNQTAHVWLPLPVRIPVGPSPGHYLN